jgi:hypothetical protein
MALSTSSSSDSNLEEPSSLERAAHHAALPVGLRLTAADRPGMAQPVPERDIPDQPWRVISLTVLVLVVLMTCAWEWQMRRLELVPGDLSSSYDTWADLRRDIDRRDVPLVLIGDSRILYDSDLDRVQKLTGIFPIQLGIAGGTGLLVLEDIASDPHFKGLAIVGMAETSYFDTIHVTGRTMEALQLSKWESPSKRASYAIQRVISPGLAMLDDDYGLSTLVAHLDTDWRPGVMFGPYDVPWKAGELKADGDARLWRRLDHDKRLSGHELGVWFKLFPPFPVDDADIQPILVRTKIAVDKIRARGGDVVFLRPPSGPALKAVEYRHIPRARGWDPLLAFAHAKGVHADDLPNVQNLDLPEGSHLSHACATVFTDAYIRSVTQLTPLLSLKPNAPPGLSTRDCIPSAVLGSNQNALP